MKRNNMRIKENITIIDKIKAINSIVDAHFEYNRVEKEMKYTPYYNEMANVIAIARNFIEGVEFEDKDLVYDLAMNDDELRSLVNRFFYNIEETKDAEKENEQNQEYIYLFNDIQNEVSKIVKFKKEQLIHRNDGLELYMKKNAEMFEAFEDLFTTIADSFRNFSKLDLKTLTPETIEIGKNIMNKLKDSDITTEKLIDIIRDAAKFDIDKATTDIIDSKNKEIEELKKEVKKLSLQLNSRNVLSDK